MKQKRRREITIEFEEVFTIRRAQRIIRIWCAQCNETTSQTTPDEAAIKTGVSACAIYRWIEVAEIHFTETVDGCVLVCLNSLSG